MVKTRRHWITLIIVQLRTPLHSAIKGIRSIIVLRAEMQNYEFLNTLLTSGSINAARLVCNQVYIFYIYWQWTRKKKSRFYFVYPLLVVSLRKLNYCISVCGWAALLFDMRPWVGMGRTDLLLSNPQLISVTQPLFVPGRRRPNTTVQYYWKSLSSHLPIKHLYSKVLLHAKSVANFVTVG
jgi:hypothetical protein